MRSSNKVTLALVGISLIAAFNGYRVHGMHDWSPTVKSIDVSKASSYEFDFMPKRNSGYELELSTERKLGFEEQNCRLGIEQKDFAGCGDYNEVLDLEWSIFESGSLTAQGSSFGNTSGFWGEEVGKILHRFDASKKELYIVKIDVITPDSMLSITNPEITVSSGSMDYKDAFVIAALSYYVSIALFLMAVIVWLMGLILVWVKKKT